MTQTKPYTAVNRRTFLAASVLGAAYWAIGGGAHGDQIDPDSTAFGPIVGTGAGKVRGYVANGVYVFKGVPYGAPTGGHGRFLPSTRPLPWSGVRNALSYGAMAMQGPGVGGIYAAVLRGLDAEYPKNMSEDCLYLNIWSPEIGAGHNRPVMVWLHPGAYNGWSGNSDWTDGTNLARYHDVVMVSLNHRLGGFGFLYLGDLAGASYGKSGNVGMLDIVAALEWIQENIAAFGGNPNNVSIFGESGGGAKVSTLLAMPTAQGLFHKAIMESDVAIKGMTPEQATRVTESVLRKLAIKDRIVEQLSDVAPDRLVAASDGEVFSPVVEGKVLPRHPFSPDAPEISARVPLLLGTNSTEAEYWVLAGGTPDLSNDELLRKYLEGHWKSRGLDGPKSTTLVDMYKRFYPTASPETVMVAAGSALIRDRTQLVAELKVKQAGALAFMYEFAWEARGFGGRFHSCHCFEIPFVFDNIDSAPQLYGLTPDPRRYNLAKKISGAWAAFAHFANPSHPGLPTWKPYTLIDRATMILNDSCRLAEDPRRAERLAIERFRS